MVAPRSLLAFDGWYLRHDPALAADALECLTADLAEMPLRFIVDDRIVGLADPMYATLSATGVLGLDNADLYVDDPAALVALAVFAGQPNHTVAAGLVLDTRDRAVYVWNDGVHRLADGVDTLPAHLEDRHADAFAAVMDAVARGNVGALEPFLEEDGAELLNRRHDDGDTPFTLAIRLRQHAVVEELARSMFLETRVRDRDGRDPLEIAALHADAAMTEILCGACPQYFHLADAAESASIPPRREGFDVAALVETTVAALRAFAERHSGETVRALAIDAGVVWLAATTDGDSIADWRYRVVELEDGFDHDLYQEHEDAEETAEPGTTPTPYRRAMDELLAGIRAAGVLDTLATTADFTLFVARHTA
jgi:hypothetical protein